MFPRGLDRLKKYVTAYDFSPYFGVYSAMKDVEGKRWSRKFRPVVKVDRMTKEVIQNEETQEPLRVPQSVGQLRFWDDLTYFLDACTVRNSSTQTSASGHQPNDLASGIGFFIDHLA